MLDKNKIKAIINRPYIKYGLILLAGLLLGWFIFSGGRGGQNSPPADIEEAHEHGAEATIWICSMHPQIRMEEPGACPLCGMDLIPLQTSGSGDADIDPNAIQLSHEAAALAEVQTTIVNLDNPSKEIRLYNNIQTDKRLSQSQTSHLSGRIEKLFVTFTGESVRQGQTLATIYSPDLLNAQQELIEALKMKDTQPALLQAVREKLRLWKLSDKQIASIEQSGRVSALVDVTANTSGIVISKNINQGDYVNTGTVMFNIADLSRVWAVFDAYEADLPFLKVGDPLQYTLTALPGKTFSGKISFINPVLDPSTRTAKVRVETDNPHMELKPQMYANALLSASLKQGEKQIIIPKSAILWTGKRSIVYVKQPNTETPAFLLQEVELGPSLGDAYVILSGLEEGDEIVTKGAFTIDASAQLAGKRSMMNDHVELMSKHEGQSHQHSADPEPVHKAPEAQDIHKGNTENGTSTKQSTSAELEHAMLSAGGSCGMCKDRIEEAAMAVEGVSSAHYDLDQQLLHLNFAPNLTSADAIAKAIAEAGHDTDKYKAEDSEYDALPACCKYR